MTQVRRRPVFAISGWLMLVVLFLPTLRVCGDPTAPIEFPPAYFVYVGSIIAAFGAWSTLRRTRHIVLVVLTAMWIGAIDLVGVAILAGGGGPTIGVIAAIALLAGTIVAIRALALARTGERAFGAALVVHAAIATIWYALLVSDPDAMAGAYIGLVVTSAMLISAIAAIVRDEADRAALRRATRPAPLPIARLI